MANDKTKLNYITLYADEYDQDIWEDYCNIARAPKSSETITIYFDPANTEYAGEEEDDEPAETTPTEGEQVELKFNELFGDALFCLIEHCMGSMDEALDCLNIRDEKKRKAIKEWYGWEEEEEVA